MDLKEDHTDLTSMQVIILETGINTSDQILGETLQQVQKSLKLFGQEEHS